MSNKRAVKVNLNEGASDDLKAISESLNMPETEVLRKGILLMRLYSDLKKKSGAFLLKDDEGNVRELIIG